MQDILPTPQRPDLVLSSTTKKEVVIVELTVPFEPNIEARHTDKCNKYASLTTDIKDQGYSCNLFCLEIGSRGYVSKENKLRVKSLLKRVKQGKNVKMLLKNVSKLSLMSSYSLFIAKDEPNWMKPRILTVPDYQ